MFMQTCGSFKSANHKRVNPKSAKCHLQIYQIIKVQSCGFVICETYLRTAHLCILLIFIRFLNNQRDLKEICFLQSSYSRNGSTRKILRKPQKPSTKLRKHLYKIFKTFEKLSDYRVNTQDYRTYKKTVGCTCASG